MMTTMVGNYPKVAESGYATSLIGAITKRQRHELTEAQLEETCRTITTAVLKEQEQAGLDLLTDGQIRWEDLLTPVAKRLQGFEINGLARWFNNNVYYRRPVLVKRPVRRGPLLVDDYRFAAQCTTRPVKAILPGPYTFAVMSEDRHFKRPRAFALALAEILNEEARALAAAGAPFIQFDEPALGFGRSNARLAMEALRVAVHGVKATTAVYTYFGAPNGALEHLAKAPIDVIGLDLVSHPGMLSALKRLKTDKRIALGCLDARNTKLESIGELHALWNVVRTRIPLDRLYVNPNCGLEFLPHAQARAKVQRLVEAVRSYHA